MSKLFVQFAIILSFLIQLTLCQECTSDGKCDKHERCTVWASEGECLRERSFMTQTCPGSCIEIQKQAVKQRLDKERPCTDILDHCKEWAKLGECDENTDVLKHCPKSCGTCESDDDDDDDEDDGCTDEHEKCKMWAGLGECDKNPNYMHKYCAKSCKTCPERKTSKPKITLIQRKTEDYGELQSVEGSRADEVLKLIEESIEYMDSDDVIQLPENIQNSCKNRHELCSFWAVLGECDKNKAYMATNCGVACKTCHMIDIDKRCPKLDVPPALEPGDLNRMFERILRQAPGNRTILSPAEIKDLDSTNTPIYTVHVHSRPDPTITTTSAALDKSMPPWVITFDNFLTSEECEALIQLGYKYEYKRSEDVGDEKFDGSYSSIQSEKRTSVNAWCSTQHGCRAEDIPQRIHQRMSTVMNIPSENSEDLQMLKYPIGTFYRTHHDYIPHQAERQCGPRILTFFLYLSDVEEGGGTNFPQLDLTIMPKKGRALLWPSVLNSDPMKIDTRMYHQALDVKKGTKYAANGWIHMYDYVSAQKNGCN